MESAEAAAHFSDMEQESLPEIWQVSECSLRRSITNHSDCILRCTASRAVSLVPCSLRQTGLILCANSHCG